MREELIREILDKALEQELGMVVTCDNLHQATLKFHAVTKNKIDAILERSGTNMAQGENVVYMKAR